MWVKQRVSALRDGQPNDLAASEVGCGQISLQCASYEIKIAPSGREPGECRLRRLNSEE
jgi:hypothetical protein